MCLKVPENLYTRLISQLKKYRVPEGSPYSETVHFLKDRPLSDGPSTFRQTIHFLKDRPLSDLGPSTFRQKTVHFTPGPSTLTLDRPFSVKRPSAFDGPSTFGTVHFPLDSIISHLLFLKIRRIFERFFSSNIRRISFFSKYFFKTNSSNIRSIFFRRIFDEFFVFSKRKIFEKTKNIRSNIFQIRRLYSIFVFDEFLEKFVDYLPPLKPGVNENEARRIS